MASPLTSRSKLVLCALLVSEPLTQALTAQLQTYSSSEVGDRFMLTQFQQVSDFLEFMTQTYNGVDCLIIDGGAALSQVFQTLHDRSILLPTLILESQPTAQANCPDEAPSSINRVNQSPNPSLYHEAVLRIDATDLSHLHTQIEEAIAHFLSLSNTITLNCDIIPGSLSALSVQRSLMQQQHRLAEKLKERLGYLGVYYKRNPAHFLRHMDELERQELLQQLKADYRHIILHYFIDDKDLNQTIDRFVDLAFFADVPVAQIVEIHMELMDEFSKQLKLEGRSEEILLDYRLTLIDTLAHLCEMYRRSIPRES